MSDAPARRDQAEHRLSHYVDALFDRILMPPVWYSAQDHSGAAIGRSEHAQMAWRQRQKAMGIKPSQLDWRIVQGAPMLYAEIELKVRGNQPTLGQLTTIRLLKERGFPAGVAWSVTEVYEFLRTSCFRLHGNARNITLEIETRWRAEDEAERPTKKRAAPHTEPRNQMTRTAVSRARRAGILV